MLFSIVLKVNAKFIYYTFVCIKKKKTQFD